MDRAVVGRIGRRLAGLGSSWLDRAAISAVDVASRTPSARFQHSAAGFRICGPGDRATVGAERESFIDNLLDRIHFIVVMIRRTGLAPWEFQFPFPGSLTSTFLISGRQLMPGVHAGDIGPKIGFNNMDNGATPDAERESSSLATYWSGSTLSMR